MKSIIIIGSPRSGKSTLARRIATEFNINLIPMDALVTSFEKTMPKVGIRHHAASESEDKFAPFLGVFIDDLISESIRPVVVEGSFIRVSKLKEWFSDEKFNLMALGYGKDITTDELFNKIRKYDADGFDWTKKFDDDTIRQYCDKFINSNIKLRNDCEQNNIMFWDTSTNRDETLELIIKRLKKENSVL